MRRARDRNNLGLTLLLNEEARRVFLSFGAICAQPSCGLFANSATTYGKSLLYLRDQLKDLDSLHRTLSAEGDRVDAEIEHCVVRRNVLTEARTTRRKKADSAVLIEVVSDATRAIIDLQEARQLVDGLDRLEADLIDEQTSREHALAEREGLVSGRSGIDHDLVKVRIDIQEAIIRWMNVLNTNNVSRNVSVDADFTVLFGGERLKTIKGSTRTRAVLAIRTATIEVFAQTTRTGPRFFVLDTPRQQDIDRTDFAKYINALKALSLDQNVQIVFSSSNYQYPLTEGDVSWSPDFPGEEHPMFLG